MTKLSVVVPCFNCESTLEQAVASLYSQEPTFPFDVTMVDDGSTDSTYQVMTDLANRYRNIRLLRHTTNLGGGAARNTGIRKSNGDLIFCLDGDDVLGLGFLEKMTRFWNERRCDGLGMSTSIKFRGQRIQDVAYVTEFEGPGKPVRFESFLDGDRCSLGVVFLIRRTAFEQIGGYPTEHGFDTQGMAFRFLCHGLRAFTCPETVYYHRVNMPQSYYKREQRAGRLDWNWFNVFDEFLYLFGPGAQRRILLHRLFDVPGEPHAAELLSQVVGSRPTYAPGYRRLLRKGPRGVARELAGQKSGIKQYWLGNYHRLRGRPAEALTHYSRALVDGFAYRIIYHRMLQAELALAGGSIRTEDALEDLLLHARPIPVGQRPLGQRLFHRMLLNPFLRRPASAAKRLRDRLHNRKTP
jgi:glycosyltransferase involved in cell wall biosynthesis